MNSVRLGMCLAISAFALAVASRSEAAPASCESLKSLTLANTKIKIAADVMPNPEWKLPSSVFTSPAAQGRGARTTKAAFCRVALTVGTENNIEVWLPKQWNGTFQGVGNAGLTGGINYPAMAVALEAGFAAASTDTGHITDDFFDTSWITGHPERVVDFGHRAHHQMAVAAKQIISKYYGQPARKAYYTGCSSGGWQGLTEAQKYPEDYDGIVAGAPANNFVRLQARTLLEQQLYVKDPKGDISQELADLLVRGAVAKCDANDGVKDGVIDDPLKCDFDPAELACKGGQLEGCLKPAEVKRAKWLYGPQTTAQGLKLYPGPAIGAAPVTGVPGLDPRHPADMAIVLMLQQPPGWTYATFDPDKHIPQLEQRFESDLVAMNPDLSAFKARGGKLLMYHGWADNLLSPYNTLDYVDRVNQKMGAAAAQDFTRLYMIPGMLHCAGGPGTDQFDAIGAMVKWVEKGEAPASVPASHVTAGKVDRTRPLCAFPQVSKYKGTGSTDDAASFECRAPG